MSPPRAMPGAQKSHPFRVKNVVPFSDSGPTSLVVPTTFSCSGLFSIAPSGPEPTRLHPRDFCEVKTTPAGVDLTVFLQRKWQEITGYLTRAQTPDAPGFPGGVVGVWVRSPGYLLNPVPRGPPPSVWVISSSALMMLRGVIIIMMCDVSRPIPTFLKSRFK